MVRSTSIDICLDLQSDACCFSAADQALYARILAEK
jgi:hypothetical protein